MSQERFPGAHDPAKGVQRRHGKGRLWPRSLVAAAIVLSLVGSSLVSWPAAMRHAGAASGSISVNPSSGLAGITVQVSGTGFPREADLSDDQHVFTFDGNSIAPFPAIILCGDSTFGFGQACNSNSSYPFQIPPGTQPGTHTFHMVISLATGGGLVDSSVTFQIPAPPTNTPTATNTPTPTNTSPASTATATSTLPPNALTATNTNTPPPNAPTATPTPTGAPKATPTPTGVPKASPTPTGVPKKKPSLTLIALVRPDFNRDVVALALHAPSGATIHIDFKITNVMADGSVRQVFGATHDGVANAEGVFAFNLKIHFPAHKSGEAVLTISETGDGATHTVKHTYLYRVYG